MNNKALHAGIGYAIGNIIIKGLSVFTLPIFTRIMSTSDFGYYSSFITYESILFVFVGFAFHVSLKNANIEFGKDSVDNYVSTILLCPIACATLILIIAICCGNPLGNLLALPSEYLPALVIFSWSTSVVTLYNSRVAIDFESIKYLVISLASAMLNIGLSLLLMLTIFKNDVLSGRIYGMSIGSFLIAIAIVISIWIKHKPTIDFNYIKYAFTYSLPIIPHGLSQMILGQFAKIVLLKTVGSNEAGIYGFALTVLSIPQILLNSFDSSYSQWFYNQYQLNEIDKIKKTSKEYAVLMIVVIAAFCSVAPEIVKILSEKSYWESILLVIILGISIYLIFLYDVIVLIEYYNGKTKFVALGTVGAALINVLLCYIVIPQYGMIAAAGITTFVYGLYLIFHTIIANRITNGNLPFDIGFFAKSTILVVVIAFISGVFKEKWYVRYATLIIVIVIAYLKNRNTVNNILVGIKLWKKKN